MRITGGTFKGRKLSVPKGLDIRPSTDKVRQAVFNILLSYDLPAGARVLDLFCGTGALGLEALSRGAEHCLFVDKKTACAQQNLLAIAAIPSYRLIQKDVLKLGPADSPVTLVFCDPPYRKSLITPALENLAHQGWLDDKTLCIIECEKDYQQGLPSGFSMVDQRFYGDVQIIIARYK